MAEVKFEAKNPEENESGLAGHVTDVANSIVSIATNEQYKIKHMPKGDYTIQVHVIEARDLQPRDFGETADPVCVIEVFDVKKSTQIYHNSLNVTFDERLTYHFENMQSAEMARGKIKLTVWDSNTILSNKLIGSCEIDIETIYFEKNHELYQQWIAITDFHVNSEDSDELTNPNSNDTSVYNNGGVQGYLLVTLVVLGPNDEQYIRSEAEESLGLKTNKDINLLSVMMPPRIEYHPFTLKFYILEAQYLPGLDFASKLSDPYVQIEFMKTKVQTQIKKGVLNPKFYEVLTIDVMEPLLADKIIISLWDYDRGMTDDLMGVITLSYKEIKDEAFGYNLLLPRWYHIYGAPPNNSMFDNKLSESNQVKLMNNGITKGVCYRGSVMLSATIHETKFKSKNKQKHLFRFGGKLFEKSNKKNKKRSHSVATTTTSSGKGGKSTKLESSASSSSSDDNIIIDADYHSESVKIPQSQERAITQPLIAKYFLEIDCYEAVECRGGKGSFAIRVAIRALTIESGYVECDELGHCGWYQMLNKENAKYNKDKYNYFESNKIELNFPLDLSQCPDVFFYLVQDNDDIVGYKRMTWEYLLNLGCETPPQWYEFEQSDTLTKLGIDEFPGTVLLGLRAGLMDKPDTISSVQAQSLRLPPSASAYRDPLLPISANARPFSNPEALTTVFSLDNGFNGEDFKNLLKSKSQIEKAGTYDEMENISNMIIGHQGNMSSSVMSGSEFLGASASEMIITDMNIQTVAHIKHSPSNTGDIDIDDSLLEEAINESGIDRAMSAENESKLPQIDRVTSDENYAAKNMRVPRIGTVKLTVIEACNLPLLHNDTLPNPYTTIVISNDDTKKYEQKTETIKKSIDPRWDKTYTFKNVSIYDDIIISLYQSNGAFTADTMLGNGKIILNNFIQRKCLKMGTNFDFTQEVLLSQDYVNLSISIKIEFEFNPPTSNNFMFANIDPSTPKAKSEIGLNILGRPGSVHLKLRVYLYQARNLPGIYDTDGLCDPYFKIQYCGVKAQSRVINDTLNPHWMEVLELNVDVPQYSVRKHTKRNSMLLNQGRALELIAPKIRCSLYDRDPELVNRDDFIGRFSILFNDVLAMMRDKEPKWYHLKDSNNNLLKSQVYIACEFLNPNNPFNIPKFSMMDATDEYHLHLLTIGVRGLKSSFPIFKPSINYYPSSNSTHIDSISTEVSCDPTAKNANYLELQKLTLQISKDYELAPVINIIVKDNLFRGFGIKSLAVQRNIGNGSLDLHDFMIKLKKRKDWSKDNDNNNDKKKGAKSKSGIVRDTILRNMSINDLNIETIFNDKIINPWILNEKVKKPQLIHPHYQKNETYIQRIAELRTHYVMERVNYHSRKYNAEDARYKAEKFSTLYTDYNERVEADPLKAIDKVGKDIGNLSLIRDKFAIMDQETAIECEKMNTQLFEFNPSLKTKLDEYISKPVYFESETEIHERLQDTLKEIEENDRIFQAMSGKSSEFEDEETKKRKAFGRSQSKINIAMTKDKSQFEDDTEPIEQIEVVTDKVKPKHEAQSSFHDQSAYQEQLTSHMALTSNEVDDEKKDLELAATSGSDGNKSLSIKVTKADFDDDDDNDNEEKDDAKLPLLNEKEEDGDSKKTRKRAKSKQQKESDVIREKLAKITAGEQAAMIQAKMDEWERVGLENCFDLDKMVHFKESDFEPEYLQHRVKYKTELELADDMKEKLEPFQKIPIYSGNSNIVNPTESEKYDKKNKYYRLDNGSVGFIKGLWALTRSDQPYQPFGNGVTSLLETTVVSIRVYILNGYHLTSTDGDNKSDPYLKVKLGKEQISTRDRYIRNDLEPRFHETFEFIARLPGASQLRIQVWDWDGIGDDLVGQTIIDVEDRWFSSDWRRLKMKPLEERTLRHPRSLASFGKLRMWIDIYSIDEAKRIPLTNIALPEPSQFELRCIVWKAKDVVIKDTITDQNDLRVIGKLNNQGEILQQETDIHWRSKSRKGSWNWRMIFPITLPIQKRCNLQLSMWDTDVFSANDSIGEINFDLGIILSYMYKIYKKYNVKRLILRENNSKLFWKDMIHSKFSKDRKHESTKSQAKLQISMELFDTTMAKKFPAGLGRGEPNANPFLPPPEGRFRWTWNPFEIIRQILGNKLCFKLTFFILLSGLIAVLIFFGPQLFIHVMSNYITTITNSNVLVYILLGIAGLVILCILACVLNFFFCSD